MGVPVTGTCTVWRSGSGAPEEERPAVAHTLRWRWKTARGTEETDS